MVILVVVALLVIGPERLPEYVAKLRQTIRDLKRLADGARTQLRDQMGPEFDNVDWTAYDIRQYDPRRIVREAITDAWNEDTGATDADAKEPQDRVPGAGAQGVSGVSGTDTTAGAGESTPARRMTPDYTAVHDPSRPVPFDDDAT
nr:twin-arginine translocase TatA/TatE family subunit [Kineosphaera limosa]